MKIRIGVEAQWRDMWLGMFVAKPIEIMTAQRKVVGYRHTVYICVIPMLPIKLWWTEFIWSQHD